MISCLVRALIPQPMESHDLPGVADEFLLVADTQPILPAPAVTGLHRAAPLRARVRGRAALQPGPRLPRTCRPPACLSRGRGATASNRVTATASTQTKLKPTLLKTRTKGTLKVLRKEGSVYLYVNIIVTASGT